MGDSILLPPTLSSSSIKITHGALALASPRRRSKTRQNVVYLSGCFWTKKAVREVGKEKVAVLVAFKEVNR